MSRPFFYEVSSRSVFAVWRRHLTIYRKTWLTNLIPPVSEPIIYLIGFGLGFAPLVSQIAVSGRRMGYLEFLAPGMIATGLLFQAFFESVYGTFIRIRYDEVWQGMLTAPLSFGDIFFGDLLWATTKGALTGILTGLVAVLWGIMPGSSLIIFLPWIILGSLVFAALGMFAAGVVRSIDEINVPCFLLVIPMPLFCGAYFPRDVLPPAAYSFTGWLPLTVLIDVLRGTATPGEIIFAAAVLVFWFAFFALPAAALLRRKVIH